MFCGRPLAFADDRQTRAVDDEMDGLVGRNQVERDIEVLTTPRKRGVVRRLEVEIHQGHYRPQEALRLAKWQLEHEPKRQRGLDREIRKPPLPASSTGWRWGPGVRRVGGEPERDVASLDKCSLILGPIPDTIFRLVRGMHSRLHAKIVLPQPSQWPGHRRWLGGSVGFMHQRRNERTGATQGWQHVTGPDKSGYRCCNRR